MSSEIENRERFSIRQASASGIDYPEVSIQMQCAPEEPCFQPNSGDQQGSSLARPRAGWIDEHTIPFVCCGVLILADLSELSSLRLSWKNHLLSAKER